MSKIKSIAKVEFTDMSSSLIFGTKKEALSDMGVVVDGDRTGFRMGGATPFSVAVGDLSAPFLNELLDHQFSMQAYAGFPAGFSLGRASALNGEIARAYPNIGDASRNDSQRDVQVVEAFACMATAEGPFAIPPHKWDLPTVSVDDVTEAKKTRVGRTTSTETVPNFPKAPFYRAVKCDDDDDADMLEEMANEEQVGVWRDGLIVHISTAASVRNGLPPHPSMLQPLRISPGQKPQVQPVTKNVTITRPVTTAAPVKEVVLPAAWENFVALPSQETFAELSSDKDIAVIGTTRAYKNVPLGSKKHKLTSQFMNRVNSGGGIEWDEWVGILEACAGQPALSLKALKLCVNTKSMLCCDEGLITYRYGALADEGE